MRNRVIIKLQYANRIVVPVGHNDIVAGEVHRNTARRVVFRVGGNITIHVAGAGGGAVIGAAAHPIDSGAGKKVDSGQTHHRHRDGAKPSRAGFRQPPVPP